MIRHLPKPLAPYFQGYLAANAAGTTQMYGGVIRMPTRIYPDGSEADDAFIEGAADSISDRGPRRPSHRVSRAHPPWRLI